ncbi:MAG: radical SAM family heme chaperone HemW [Ignavibacteria bacterium]|nr:radical SAM family heme chaperone HemW [Ignavibacteria bacterium]
MAGVYIHIPFCEKKCIYCEFYSITNQSLKEEFIASLQKEIYLFTQIHNKKNDIIETIYIGGGTPSLLDISDVEKIISAIYDNFDTTNLKEITIECNPGSNFIGKLPDYRKIGINRISIGVQSLIPEELTFLGRIHTKEEALTSIESAINYFDNVSVDIIFSLPNQTISSLQTTLNQLTNYEISHISAYSLIYEEGTPLFFELSKGKIQPKNEDEDYELYKLIFSTLEKFGFEHYEVSNFAKPGYKSLHNLGYWEHKEYFGFGPSAHSFFNKIRTWNVRNLNKYLKLLKQNLLPIESKEDITPDKYIIEKIMLSLRAQGLTIHQLQSEFGIDLFSLSNALLLQWEESGKAKIQDGKIKLTSEGYFICDKLTIDLLDAINIPLK